ncbi:MAG: response regulator transcription factor [Anaerolineales bacterium]|nr:response regulator transcription factor [Anaerolineales bacterium]
MTPIRILLVDDHPMMREALRVVLEIEPAMQVVAEAADGQQAVQCALALQPDVIVLDLYLPVKDGVEAIAEILAQQPQARILAITSSTSDERVVAAIQAGAMGYLLKDASREEFLRGVREVAAGNTFLPPDVAAKLARGVRHSRSPLPQTEGLVEPLTPREQEVLALLSEGLSNRAIAGRLHLSGSTVRVHVSNILGKLGLENRNQAIVYVLRQERGLSVE